MPNPSTLESTPISETDLPQASPFHPTRTPTVGSEEHRDNQSIRSAQSLNTVGQGSVKHPEMHRPGLNASIVETVSAWFTEGQLTKSVVIGELALVHNSPFDSAQRNTERIRLDNFPVLEKVAPNPIFVNQVHSSSGEYTIDLSHVAKTSVAFKYQVHLDQTMLAIHVPVILIPTWKVEATQASVILSYAFNHTFASAALQSVTLQNVLVMINIENATATSCLSKPVGHFIKEKNTIYWKLGDLTLDSQAKTLHKLLARFTTEGEAKPGTVEARWEISGEGAGGIGSGLGLSSAADAKEEGTNPFEDQGNLTRNVGTNVYKEVPITRRLVSGKYITI